MRALVVWLVKRVPTFLNAFSELRPE